MVVKTDVEDCCEGVGQLGSTWRFRKVDRQHERTSLNSLTFGGEEGEKGQDRTGQDKTLEWMDWRSHGYRLSFVS
jgi:hypothetical protein